MFTGIIEDVGRIERIETVETGRTLSIATTFASALSVDESVAVNGACLTVVDRTETTFTVNVIEETLDKTTLGTWTVGQTVNLERAMMLGHRLDGHLVQGHIDQTTEVLHVVQRGTEWRYTLRLPEGGKGLVIPVGSIALDGISLTIAQLTEDDLTVAIIPYTYEHTIIKSWSVGTRVNVEYDLIGKYVARQHRYAGASGP